MSPSWLRESGICETACACRMMYAHRARRRRAPGRSATTASARSGSFSRMPSSASGARKSTCPYPLRAAHPQPFPLQSAQALRRRGLAAFEFEDAAAVIHAHRRHAAAPHAVIAAVFRNRGAAQQDGSALHAQLARQSGLVETAGPPKVVLHRQRRDDQQVEHAGLPAPCVHPGAAMPGLPPPPDTPPSTCRSPHSDPRPPR